MSELAISDHALIRWIERTGMADLEPLRSALRDSLARATGAADCLDADEYMILAHGLVYVIRNNTVVTVLEDKGRLRRLRRPARKGSRSPRA